MAEWMPRYFESGTTIVDSGVAGEPWLYIYGPGNEDEDQWMRDRFAMCEQLAEWMNGGKPRPQWLSDMERQTEESAVGLDGSSVTAVGPLIDINPPNLHWVTDNSEEAKNKRARLMDRIFNHG